MHPAVLFSASPSSRSSLSPNSEGGASKAFSAQYETAEDAASALSLNGRKVQGSALTVEAKALRPR